MRSLTLPAAVLALALALPANAAAPAVRQIDLVERATTDTISLHGGTAADNVGDVATFTNEIFDAANVTKVGSNQGICVRMVVGKALECHLTLMLADGQIMVAGPVLDGVDSALAIVGGTGAYVGARGEMLIHARDAKASAYDFHYRLM
ncbi:allene oxide cyclase family protein [Novosphingobium sp. Chol11]|uniref:allene oxide cyclase family protein n=1 Tax=Novosphingobium sp. Chol11 TaxID=1385763 RepID=UPI0025EEE8DF|nr:allene oxide cyclase family protein [Novosphingobium sp. Chol11]